MGGRRESEAAIGARLGFRIASIKTCPRQQTRTRTDKLTNKHTEMQINGGIDRQRQILARTARTCSAPSKAHLSLPMHLSFHLSASSFNSNGPQPSPQ